MDTSSPRPPTDLPTDPEVIEALTFLRGHTAGTFLVDGAPRPCRYVIDPADGSIITALDPRDLDAQEYLLCLPDDSFDAPLRALVVPAALGGDGVWADRHGAYHGPARDAAWVRCAIEHVKLASGPVVDGEQLMIANPFAGDQTRLCAALNRDRDALRRVCDRAAGVSVEDPFAVGVDPMGVDIRARFGVVRVVFDEPVRDADDALRVLAGLS